MATSSISTAVVALKRLLESSNMSGFNLDTLFSTRKALRASPNDNNLGRKESQYYKLDALRKVNTLSE